MGCCSVRDEKFTKENNNTMTIDFAKKNMYMDSLPGLATQEKMPLSMENAKSFFKQKGSNQENGTVEEATNNLITPNNGNINREDLSNGEMVRKEKSGRDDEFREKRNKEEEKRETFNILKSMKENEIFKFPRIELLIVNSRLSNMTNDKIVITPNSINGTIKKTGDKFLFGRNSSTQQVTSSLLGSLPTFVSQNSLNPKPNDYNFADESIGIRQFEISYSKEKEKFFIVDNKKGTGLFVKIKNYVVIDHDMIVSFCASHMILQVESEVYHPENKIIKIRFLQGPHQNQEKVFNSKDKKIIRIGRSKQAEVVYKDDSVSRIQCTIVFERGDWNLYDGYLDNGNKGSTNGLWLLASSKIEMTNEMVLKTGNTTLFVKLFESESED